MALKEGSLSRKIIANLSKNEIKKFFKLKNIKIECHPFRTRPTFYSSGCLLLECLESETTKDL